MPISSPLVTSTRSSSSKSYPKRPRPSFVLVPISPDDDDDSPSLSQSDFGRGKRQRRVKATVDLSDEALGLLEPRDFERKKTREIGEGGRTAGLREGASKSRAGRIGGKNGRSISRHGSGSVVDWDELPTAAALGLAAGRGRRSSLPPSSTSTTRSATEPTAPHQVPSALHPPAKLSQHCSSPSTRIDHTRRSRSSATFSNSIDHFSTFDTPPTARRTSSRLQTLTSQANFPNSAHLHQSSPASDTSSPLSSAPSTARSTPRLASITVDHVSSNDPPFSSSNNEPSIGHSISTRSRTYPQSISAPEASHTFIQPPSHNKSGMEVEEVLYVSAESFSRPKRKISSSNDEPPCLSTLVLDDSTTAFTPPMSRRRTAPRKSLLSFSSNSPLSTSPPATPPVSTPSIRNTRSAAKIATLCQDSPRPPVRRTTRISSLSSVVDTPGSPLSKSATDSPSSRKKLRIRPSFNYEPLSSSSDDNADDDLMDCIDDSEDPSHPPARLLRSQKQSAQEPQRRSTRSSSSSSLSSTPTRPSAKADTPKKRASSRKGGRKTKRKKIVMVEEPEEEEDEIKVAVSCGLQMESIAEEDEEELKHGMEVDGEEHDDQDWREDWWEGFLRRTNHPYEWTMVI